MATTITEEISCQHVFHHSCPTPHITKWIGHGWTKQYVSPCIRVVSNSAVCTVATLDNASVMYA